MIVPNRDKERRELEIKRLNEQTEILVKHAGKFIADRYIEKERVREAIKECLEYQSCWQPSDKENFHIDHKLYLSIIAKWERQLKGLLKELGLEDEDG